jgi:hypothetical protein
MPMQDLQATGTLSLRNFGLSSANKETGWGRSDSSKSSILLIKTNIY